GLVQVPARAEGLFAGAGQDGDADVVVFLDAAPGLVQLGAGFGVDAVHRLGAIQRDRGNVVTDFKQYGHDFFLARRAAGSHQDAVFRELIDFVFRHAQQVAADFARVLAQQRGGGGRRRFRIGIAVGRAVVGAGAHLRVVQRDPVLALGELRVVVQHVAGVLHGATGNTRALQPLRQRTRLFLSGGLADEGIQRVVVGAPAFSRDPLGTGFQAQRRSQRLP